MSKRSAIGCLLLAILATGAPPAAAAPADRWQQLARELLADLVARRTVAGSGQVPAMAEALAARFLAGGFAAGDVHVLPLAPDLASLVVRYRGDGSGGAPILLVAHLDVVDARREDWEHDPFVLREEDGYFYGRGTVDNKSGVALLATTFLRLRHEGWVPTRDLVLAFTGDEETGMLTTRALVEEHRELTDVAFALNADAGGGYMDEEGRALRFVVQAAEKTYATYHLTVRNRGGHSSLPREDNAIYQLAAALGRLAAHRFPVEVNDVTREYFRQMAATYPEEDAEPMRRFAADPADAAAAEALRRHPNLASILGTTCVATMIEGGHAENALPQSATATVNCRIFPGTSPQEVAATLGTVVADEEVAIALDGEPLASPASPLRDDVMAAVAAAVHALHPGVPIVPAMAPYGTDGLVLRNAGIPTYGVAGLFSGPDDDRAHGQDERISVATFYDSLAYWEVLLKELAAAPAVAD